MKIEITIISIHVLRVEDDPPRPTLPCGRRDFNPRPPCGGRRIEPGKNRGNARFQSTSSVWRTTTKSAGKTTKSGQFQSTSSVWRTTSERWTSWKAKTPFQSTSSVWRTTILALNLTLCRCISIHVLRVEDDSHVSPTPVPPSDFNPRPPCGGRLEIQYSCLSAVLISIHVLRVEDDCDRHRQALARRNFNPRPPCGGRHLHTRPPKWRGGFQSTSSVWRTTFTFKRGKLPRRISIHVLRVEDDMKCSR